MDSDQLLPHFLRFARALTLGSGLALSGGMATGCDWISSVSSDAAMPPIGVQVVPTDAGGVDHFLQGIKPAPVDASDAQMPFPGIKPLPLDASGDGDGAAIDASDAQLPFPGIKVMPPDGGGDGPVPSGGPLAAPNFVA